MKKLLALLLIAAMLFAFTGCGEKPVSEEPVNNNNQTEDNKPVEKLDPPADLEVLDLGKYKYSSKFKDFEISDVEGLKELSRQVLAGNDFTECVVTLTADIDMNPGLDVLDENFDFIGDVSKLVPFDPIGSETSEKYFSGTFDGNNHVIRGLYINIQKKQKGVGLFGFVDGAEIKDLSIIDSYITADFSNDEVNRIGTVVGLAGEEGLKIENVYVNSYINGKWLGPKGLAELDEDIIKALDIKPNAAGNIYGSEYIGGVIGRSNGDFSATNCIFNGKLYDAYGACGGFVGRCTEDCEMENCLVIGSLTCPGGKGDLTSSFEISSNESSFVIEGFVDTNYGKYKKSAVVLSKEELKEHYEEAVVGKYTIYKMLPDTRPTFTVSFEVNNAEVETAPSAVTVKKGSRASLPEIDSTNYSLKGWYESATPAEDALPYNSEITGDKTLYAVWEAKKLVEFDISNWTGDDNVITKPADQKVAAGESAKQPNEKMETEDYAFKGWFKEATPAADAKAFNFLMDDITEDIILYAVWERKVEVKYDLSNWADKPETVVVPAQKIVPGAKATEPKFDNAREGFVFKGWFKEAVPVSEAVAFDFAKDPIKEDITLYAVWEVAQ